jgi:predicted nucleic acid-binding protein
VIAVDSSTWVAFFEGDSGEDSELLVKALQERQVLMPPAVLTELLSAPQLPSAIAATLLEIPLIDVTDGFWERAGALRGKVLAKRQKARLGDALIAQSCLDRGVPLLTRDRDFHAYRNIASLDLVIR